MIFPLEVTAVIVACSGAPSLQWTELTVEGGLLISVQSIVKEVHTAGLLTLQYMEIWSAVWRPLIERWT